MPGDQIFVVCDPEQRDELVTLAGKHEHAIHSVMILGGGLIGRVRCERDGAMRRG